MELIKALFSLAKSFKIWGIRKIYSLALLGLQTKPYVSKLRSPHIDEKAEAALEILALIGAYKKDNPKAFDELLDALFEIAQEKKADALILLETFLGDNNES